MTLEDHGNNNYSSESDLKAMGAVGNDLHSHIGHFYAALMDFIDGQLVICMEALEASMDKFYAILHSCVQPQSILLDILIRRLAKHIVLALDYLKSKNIIHRDIKPQNMLITRPAIFKLCDFGICGTLKDSISSTYLGSLRYLPPERLGNTCSYGTRSDMWALEMSLLEISQGCIPLACESILSSTTTMVPPNLLMNPGAELSVLSDWTQTGSSSVLQDTGGLLNSGYNQRTGTACFAGGYGSGGTPSILFQNVNLINGPQNFSTAQIDAGTLSAEVSFYYQTWYDYWLAYDDAQVTITFRSATNTILGTQTAGPLDCTLHANWCYNINLYSIPSGTRSIDYTMTFIRNAGTNIDAYIDDNSLRVV
ncbi:unnamed protein product [Rotaria sp. Silwood2]|nr:unnamed protein product [Rotaria sp. Silwood2]CAF4031671.1 unnamed protein product [Rotaria sp. Silwood2]CAF4146164.1 unnamed protein product [Rotaria sp. Silwood2]CAF4256023.1 unnamed protein product [Rotaria sp. Silwood2]